MLAPTSIVIPQKRKELARLTDEIERAEYPTERMRERMLAWINGRFQSEHDADPKRFVFSNYQPCRIAYDGVYYPSVEHAYWAARTINLAERRIIKATKDPGEARHLARIASSTRPDWLDWRCKIMYTLLFQKFAIKAHYLRLMEFDGPIQYWNLWCETYWGQCLCKKHRGDGLNVLGNLIMEIKETILHAAD